MGLKWMWRLECVGQGLTAAIVKKEGNFVINLNLYLFFLINFLIASTIQQEETCIERDNRERPLNKLQSAIYYALDGDQVTILTMLAQRSEDPWVKFEKTVENFKISFPEWYFSSQEALASRRLRAGGLALYTVSSD